MTGPGKEEGKGRTKKNGVSSSLPTIATDQTASFWWWWWCAGEICQISKELLFCTNSNFFSVKNKTKKNLKCGEFLSSPSLSYHLGELFRRQDNVLLPLARQKEKRRERGGEGGESGLLQMVLRGKKPPSTTPLSPSRHTRNVISRKTIMMLSPSLSLVLRLSVPHPPTLAQKARDRKEPTGWTLCPIV